MSIQIREDGGGRDAYNLAFYCPKKKFSPEITFGNLCPFGKCVSKFTPKTLMLPDLITILQWDNITETVVTYDPTLPVPMFCKYFFWLPG